MIEENKKNARFIYKCMNRKMNEDPLKFPELWQNHNYIIPDELILKIDPQPPNFKYNRQSEQNPMVIFTGEDQIQAKQFLQIHSCWADAATRMAIPYDNIKDINKVSTVQKKTNTQVHVVFIIEKYSKENDNDKNHVVMQIIFTKQASQLEAMQKIKDKLKEREERFQNLFNYNYMGLSKNQRTTFEHILKNDRSKLTIFNHAMRTINEKVRERKTFFTPEQKKIMLRALASDTYQACEMMIKKKIQAFEIDKDRLGYEITKSRETVTLMDAEDNQHYNSEEMEGYSRKRVMDGVLVCDRDRDNDEIERVQESNKKFADELYFDNVHYREEFQINRLLFPQECLQAQSHNPHNFQYQWFNMQKDHEELHSQKAKDQNKKGKGLWQDRLKIPKNQYSIFSKPEIIYNHSDKSSFHKNVDSNESKIAIETVKFMYRLMKANDENRKRSEEGKMSCVLDALKDLLIESERKFPENSSMKEMIKKANANYMKYKREMYK